MLLGEPDMIFSISAFTLISSRSKLLNLNTQKMREIFETWGPSARNCIKFTKDPDEIILHEQDVVEAANGLTKNDNRFTDFSYQATHQIFVVRPSGESRQLRTVTFISDHVREIVSRAYAAQDRIARYSFYRTIRGNPSFGGPAGEM
jgi:hypothetical protein